MSNFFQSQSRRKFLKVAGASADGSVFFKGCLGNPPDPNAATETTLAPAAQTPGANVKPAQAPFVNTVKLGFIPIVESAAMVLAKEKGFFAKYGMTNVEIYQQANWASARDNVTIASAGGGIDRGQWQIPMPHWITEEMITAG